MNKKWFFIIISVFAVFVIAVSFVTLKLVSVEKKRTGKIDVAEILYERADQFLQKNQEGKAISGFVRVINQYSGSPYAEKSLRGLASIYSRKGDYAKSGYYYRRLLKNFPGIKDAEKIRSELENSNMRRLVSPVITEDSVEYIVVKGDSLYAIAKRFNTTVALIKRVNALQSNTIKSGQRLKISVSNFSILIDVSKNVLTLKKDGEPFKTYPVAAGKDDSTPLGVFVIADKMVKPVWTNPEGEVIPPDSEEYELGERWLGLSAQGYGIHGTCDADSIGKHVTAGCVRMHNRDVIELYDIVTEGTEVEIIGGVR